MKTVTIHQAKTHLSRLLREAEQGDSIVIARGKQPIARLVPIEKTRPQRTFGTARGLIEVADDFDAPLEDFGDYQ